MAKKLPNTFEKALGYDGKKVDEDKALNILKRVGIDAISDLGETPLAISASYGNVTLVKVIIKELKNREDNSEIFGEALLNACSNRRLDVIQLLVQEGANIEKLDSSYGHTPLSMIFINTFSDPIPSARYLITKGAKVTPKFLKMGMMWDSEKFITFLEEQNIKFDKNLIPKNEIEEEEELEVKIDIDNLHNIINKKEYAKTEKVIWQKLVPSRGQANTVQGELLRAIEKLRDEAQRNGNANFSKNCHGLLIHFLKNYLLDENIFDAERISKLKKSLKIISSVYSPYTEDDIYDLISKSIVDWFLKNPILVPHIKNDVLYC